MFKLVIPSIEVLEAVVRIKEAYESLEEAK